MQLKSHTQQNRITKESTRFISGKIIKIIDLTSENSYEERVAKHEQTDYALNIDTLKARMNNLMEQRL